MLQEFPSWIKAARAAGILVLIGTSLNHDVIKAATTHLIPEAKPQKSKTTILIPRPKRQKSKGPPS